jgi:hypothetical protein
MKELARVKKLARVKELAIVKELVRCRNGISAEFLVLLQHTGEKF